MTAKSFLLFCVFFLIDKTCTWTYRRFSDFETSLNSSKALLICTWHGNFIFPMIFLKREHSDTFVISSTHKDSLVLGKILQFYGFRLIKGSSTRGFRNVLKQMILQFKNAKSVVAITNDGPKGPARIAKEGALNLAHKMGAEILFITGKSSSFWTLRTWDSFVLPKPFAKNIIYIERIEVPHDLEKQKVASYVSDKMNQIQNDIDNITI